MLRKPFSSPGEAAPSPPTDQRRNDVLVDVVVLSSDPQVFQAAKDAIGERNPVWRARSAEEAADLLITGRCGVLVIDMAAVSVRADTLIEQIVQQFPDVVVCVAGTRDDEPLLAPLISEGLVYRFMHKPASARRAGMFLQAAIRRHVERREGREAGDPLLPLLRGLRRPAAGMPRIYLGLLGLVTVAVTAAIFVGSTPDPVAAVAQPAPAAPQVSVKPSGVRADPVLSRARAALQAGRLEAPDGRNALDLFQAVLLAQPDHPEARASLEKTVDLLLQRARQEADAGRKDEAERLLQRVLAVVPGQGEALALSRRINPPDTPSRQLSREQLAEVEAGLEATQPAGGGAVYTEPKTLEEIEAALAALPGPVTRMAPPAAAASGTSTTPSSTVAAAAVVRPDPLAARVVNAGTPPAPLARSYARPVPNPLPTVGLSGPASRRDSSAAPAAATGSAMIPGIVSADALDRVVFSDPVYPPQALRSGTRGWVEVEFTILPTGTVSDIAVIAAEPHGVFESAATAAVAGWRYRPRTVNGQPMAQRATVTLRFDVDG